jgi:hypothetical protein
VRWLARFRLNRAAKQYAAKLPHQLHKGWGRAEHYTPGQIESAVQKSRLDERWIAFAYAAFLPEHQFKVLVPKMPVPLAYEQARALFRRHLPSKPWSAAWQPLGENPNASLDSPSTRWTGEW